MRRRKQEIREKARHQEDESSSSDESTTETDKEENSDAPVFRASHSVFPSVPPQLPPKIPITQKETTDQPSTPCIPPMSSSYTDVYVDGACCDNGGIRPRAGIGVWFGPGHPLNVSQRSTGRQTNNASEIEAATTAIKKAKRAGINQLRIKTDSKVLVQGIQEWVPKWQENDWKTNENKPVKNKSAYERLVKAMKGLDVIWEHVPGHDGINGNENADRLAREGALLEPPSDSSSSSSESADQEDVEEISPEHVIVAIPPPPPDSEESSERNQKLIRNHSKIQQILKIKKIH
ncbi:ribonuclease H1-like [Leptopilina heterotoma]|uniref:ribonuclease H1-like n=1 Tax=Leptopilina heterotoma TaxID=63436 RepID=UPI001CA9DD69|nr:ribonuclease H1-like [Leptopilina heterotoma]